MISHNQPFHPVPPVSPGEVDDQPDQPDPQDTAFNPEYARFATETSGEVAILTFGFRYCGVKNVGTYV